MEFFSQTICLAIFAVVKHFGFTKDFFFFFFLITTTFWWNRAMKDLDQPWYLKISIENQFYKTLQIARTESVSRSTSEYNWTVFSKSSVLFLEHICLLKWTMVLLAMVSFGKCFNIHKTLHVSLSIFLKRFSICDSVTTVLSSFSYHR